MKRILACISVLLLLISMTLSSYPVLVEAASSVLTTPTGYTSAEEVKYVTSGKYVANWGARGENCIFLSTYAQSYYSGSYSFNTMSQKDGGTSQSNAPSSELYKALKAMMVSKHSYIIGYQATRSLYRYTDCLNSDTSHISSFYSGKILNGAWDSGKTWNREHTWPNSKGLGGSDEDDIMMLRPTWVQENSDRGNKAYGESAGYYDPGVSVRGDCARIILYVYVRWGNINRMWGSSGVMESLDVLLKWMEEDPVDTWEMGRNDAVQSITGVRNVFVDYPEYAWLLFGEDVPDGISLPSGNTGSSSGNGGSTGNDNNSNSQSCKHSKYSLKNYKEATCGTEGYDGDYVCSSCGHLVEAGRTIPATGNHQFGEWIETQVATQTNVGIWERSCSVCKLIDTKETPRLPIPEDPSVTEPTQTEPVQTESTHTEPTIGKDSAIEPNTTTALPMLWIIVGAVIIVSIGAVIVVLLIMKKSKANKS
ncbi:MAG: endonuclease [Oscillospiraceae bacterium]|nr:endonuclease [Oscillospiraceae bacterium]